VFSPPREFREMLPALAVTCSVGGTSRHGRWRSCFPWDSLHRIDYTSKSSTSYFLPSGLRHLHC